MRVRKSDLPRDGLGRLRAPGQPDAMAHLRGLGDRVADPAEALRLGARLFDEERFFEAYVHFALAWKRTRVPAHRGLAQVAAGLCHVQRGNAEGARRLLEKSSALLADPSAEAVAGDAVAERVRDYLEGLRAGRPPAFFRLPPPTR